MLGKSFARKDCTLLHLWGLKNTMEETLVHSWRMEEVEVEAGTIVFRTVYLCPSLLHSPEEGTVHQAWWFFASGSSLDFLLHFSLDHNIDSLSWRGFVVVQSLSHVRVFATPWTAACQASLPFTISQGLLKLMSIESVMPSNHLILCLSLHLLPSILLSIRGFSNESVLRIRWQKY